MCYPIKDPLLLIEKSSPYNDSSEIPLLLSEWSFTICLTFLCASLNKAFNLPSIIIEEIYQEYLLMHFHTHKKKRN